MMINSFLFKQKARQALRGNWQTALVVTFFAGVFATLAEVLQSVTLDDVRSVMGSLTAALGAIPEGASLTSRQALEVSDLYRRLFSAVDSIPKTMWLMLIGANVLSILLTPALSLSCSRYFICRMDGEELGVKEGLLSRLRIWLKALWLYALMFIKIFLWSLLFVIPGFVAALRYSMAPYFMAEDPSLSAKQAIEKSKAVMKDKKFSFFMLMISFIGWSLLIDLVQMLLAGMLGAVLTLVLAQFMSLMLSAYMNASYAAFYCANTRVGGMEDLLSAMRMRMKQMGMSDQQIHDAGFAPGDEEKPDDGGDLE